MGALFSKSTKTVTKPEKKKVTIPEKKKVTIPEKKKVTITDFEKLALDAKLAHYTADPPPSITVQIVTRFPQIKDEPKKIKAVYDFLVHYARAHWNVENIEFLAALHAAKEKYRTTSDHDCKTELSKIFTDYVSTSAAKMVNVGHARATLIAAATHDPPWDTESNPSEKDGAWFKAEKSVEENFYDRLMNPKISRQIKGIITAHEAYYNELLGIDAYDYDNGGIGTRSGSIEGGYMYDYNNNNNNGYKVQGLGHYSNANSRGDFVNGYTDPTMIVMAMLLVCVCMLCVVFGNFISCVVGYMVGRYNKQKLVSVKEREYVSDRV